MVPEKVRGIFPERYIRCKRATFIYKMCKKQSSINLCY